MDAETLECLGILEQATAACWGSLAVIDRCEVVGLIQQSFPLSSLLSVPQQRLSIPHGPRRKYSTDVVDMYSTDVLDENVCVVKTQ